MHKRQGSTQTHTRRRFAYATLEPHDCYLAQTIIPHQADHSLPGNLTDNCSRYEHIRSFRDKSLSILTKMEPDVKNKKAN
jgi:hypothetical protein